MNRGRLVTMYIVSEVRNGVGTTALIFGSERPDQCLKLEREPYTRILASEYTPLIVGTIPHHMRSISAVARRTISS